MTLALVAAIPRILGAFLLPNAFGDAYVYIRDIGVMSTKMSGGTFALTDLFGFWLPLYQFVCALINVFVGNGFYVGKIVSAVFGIATCLFVYSITMRLTAHRTAALLAFALIALNPLHIFYSASAMTDVPHAFLVLTSLYFVLKRHWVIAAVFAALAGLTRLESWMFIALIPAIQFFKERRISVVALVILVIPPLFWFYVSWKATGNWLACFQARQQYHDWLLTMNPTLASFSLAHLLRDTATLLISTDIAVLIGPFVAGSFIVRTLTKPVGQKPDQPGSPGGQPDWGGRKGGLHLQRNITRPLIKEEDSDVVAALIFFFAFLTLIVLAYVTGTQPIIFPRYGLILFSLGIPILAWTLLTLRRQKPQWAGRLLISVIGICVFDASVQLVGSVCLLNQISAQRVVADYLRAHFQPNSNAHIFCDDGTVIALSGIPPDRFLTSSDAPRDREGFLAFLKERDVQYLVFVNKADSTPAKQFPDLENGNPNDSFEPLMNSHRRFLLTNIWLYRVRVGAIARP